MRDRDDGARITQGVKPCPHAHQHLNKRLTVVRCRARITAPCRQCVWLVGGDTLPGLGDPEAVMGSVRSIGSLACQMDLKCLPLPRCLSSRGAGSDLAVRRSVRPLGHATTASALRRYDAQRRLSLNILEREVGMMRRVIHRDDMRIGPDAAVADLQHGPQMLPGPTCSEGTIEFSISQSSSQASSIEGASARLR